jgi:CYTH domain-containing protein
MSKIEIERKFLLKTLPEIEPKDSVKIDQFYLRNSSGIWERVRKWESNFGTRYIHTIKKNISKLENLEDEKDISEDEYIGFTQKCLSSKEDSKFIKKIRHIYPDGNLNWEVDEFDNGYRLIIAEIEIPIKTFKLKIPTFIKKVSLLEVTGLKQFSNRSLSLDIAKNYVET